MRYRVSYQNEYGETIFEQGFFHSRTLAEVVADLLRNEGHAKVIVVEVRRGT